MDIKPTWRDELPWCSMECPMFRVSFPTKIGNLFYVCKALGIVMNPPELHLCPIEVKRMIKEE